MAHANSNDYLTSFDVPTTTRENQSSPTLYKIVLQVTPRDITKNGYHIIYWKRYSDIRKFYEVLHRYHTALLRPEKFPNFPEKARFMERFDPVVVEERRLATKELVNFALQRLYLRTHESYLKFFEKGDQVFHDDIQTTVLQPQKNTASAVTEPADSAKPISPSPIVVEPVTELHQSDDFLLNFDEKNEIEQITNQNAKIINDLRDLEIEQREQVNDEIEEFQTIQNDIEQVTRLLSMPFGEETENK